MNLTERFYRPVGEKIRCSDNTEKSSFQKFADRLHSFNDYDDDVHDVRHRWAGYNVSARFIKEIV